MRALWLACLLTLFAWGAQAAPSAQAQREIRGLMDALSASRCQFQRNGKWYERDEARAHLQRKYEYLLKRDLVDTAELFIERAASRSSVSGKAYRVRCPGQADVDAAAWFGGRLKAMRNSGGAAR
ncbi:MAG TPA: YfeK family protein [Pseudoxanthomonas sp.]|jgi:hypothetical protein|nr:YfeK family protein [Pseudoxanthomonas sp.]